MNTSEAFIKNKYPIPTTAFKYLEFKALMDTTVSEDNHPQAAFTKIHRHLDVFKAYNTEVFQTLHSLIVLVKL